MLLLGLENSTARRAFKEIPPGFHYSNYQHISDYIEVLSRVSCWGSLVQKPGGGKMKGRGVRTDQGGTCSEEWGRVRGLATDAARPARPLIKCCL